MRYYALSDFNGYVGQLRATWMQIEMHASREDRIVFCGNYIGDGPDPLGTLLEVMRLDWLDDRVVVLGGAQESGFHTWADGMPDYSRNPWDPAADDFLILRKMFSSGRVDQWIAALGLSEEPAWDSRTLQQSVFAALNAVDERLDGWLWERGVLYETPLQIFVPAGLDDEAGEYWRYPDDSYVFCQKDVPDTGPFEKDVIAGTFPGSHPMLADDPDYRGVYWDGASHFYINGDVARTGEIPVLIYDTATGNYSTFAWERETAWREVVIAEGRR